MAIAGGIPNFSSAGIGFAPIAAPGRLSIRIMVSGMRVEQAEKDCKLCSYAHNQPEAGIEWSRVNRLRVTSGLGRAKTWSSMWR